MAAAGGQTTSLWWDMESCSLPSYVQPYIVASMAPALLRNFNITTSMVNAGGGCSSFDDHHFSAYQFFSETRTELHQTLVNSGIRLHQLPPGKTSNEMEKMMAADVLLWAMDTPPPANIIFIVGNVDFSYLFQKLRQRSYNVFLVCQSMSESPHGMLGGVNDGRGWLSFLRSLQIEDDQSHFPGGISVCDHTFFKPETPSSSTSTHSREMEESNNPSVFNSSVYDHTFFKPEFLSSSASIHSTETEESNNPSVFNSSHENLFSLKPSLNVGCESSGDFPIVETASSSPVQPERGFHGHLNRTKNKSSRRPVFSASSTEKNKSASLEEFKAWLTLVVNSEEHAENGYYIWPIRMDFRKATGKILDERLLGFSDIRNLVEHCKDIAVVKEVKRGSHLAFPLELSTQKSSLQTEPGFHGRFINTDKPRSPVSSASSTEYKESSSLEEFKAWLARVVNSIEHAENGYDISQIRMDFEKATGKILDRKSLGISKFKNLVKKCNDIAVFKEVKQGSHLAFPLEQNKQTNTVSSPCGLNSDLSPRFKPKAETDPKLKQKASAEDFGKFIYQMLLAGEFSQSFKLDCLRGLNSDLSPRFKPKAETYPKLKQKASAEDFGKFISQTLLAGEFSQSFKLDCLRSKFEEQTGKVLDVEHKLS